MKRKIRGLIFIAAGLVMTFSAACLFSFYEAQERAAGDHAEALLQELRQEMETQVQPEMPKSEEAEPTALPQTTLNGYAVVGILQVPAVGLELPVLDNWNYDLLQLAPCRYSGSIKEGNLILLAHNYDRHFGRFKELEPGDTVSFLSVDGTAHKYTVAITEHLQKTELEKLTVSDHELTLFTCTKGGHSRVVVRCDRIVDMGEIQ